MLHKEEEKVCVTPIEKNMGKEDSRMKQELERLQL